MLNLDHIKMCFMDFDDTICIRVSHVSNMDYFDKLIARDPSLYNRGSRAVGRGIPEFISECVSRNIPLYVLTYGYSNLCYHAEFAWLKEQFGDVFKDVIITGTKDYKIDVMEHFAHFSGMHVANILYVDDCAEIVDKAHSVGIQVATPQEIALRFG